jgi:hypothetical protein
LKRNNYFDRKWIFRDDAKKIMKKDTRHLKPSIPPRKRLTHSRSFLLPPLEIDKTQLPRRTTNKQTNNKKLHELPNVIQTIKTTISKV